MWYGETRTEVFPSGKTVTYRGVDLLSLGAEGQFPLRLVAMTDGIDTRSLSDGDLSGYLAMLNAIAIAAYVEPRLSRDGKDGTIPVGMVPPGDKTFLLGRLTGSEVSRQAERFREKPNGNDPAGSDWITIRQETVGNGWP